MRPSAERLEQAKRSTPAFVTMDQLESCIEVSNARVLRAQGQLENDMRNLLSVANIAKSLLPILLFRWIPAGISALFRKRKR